ncbi:MAG: formylglycine-generating enzyme family protein [Acidobacteriota bacterium]
MSTAYRVHPLERGLPPAWASEWGEDEHGPFVAFEVEGVRQGLRWIPRGRFRMGSPEDEEERAPWEMPVHDVTLNEGLWLADTPCTQALWQAVMGENPSQFSGEPERPVEQVSWGDCQVFFERLEQHVPGLQARLPTEAEWERACRAGGNDARHGALDDVAWYRQNSEGTTHQVGLKQPNAWGLHDMLGNVFEWCSDWFVDGGLSEAVSDPTGPEMGTNRTIRGGSSADAAGGCRAAYRFGAHPGDRWYDQGFRLSRGQL